MIPYLVVYLWSEEDQVYMAFVPQLRGCKSYGSTLQEAAEMIQDAYETMAELMDELGEPLPEPVNLIHLICDANTGWVTLADENGNEL